MIKLLNVIFVAFLLLTAMPISADENTPILDFRYSVASKSDKEILVKAINAAHNNDWNKANSLAAKAQDKIIPRIIKWLELYKSKTPNLSELESFVNSHPHWPLYEYFRRRLGIEPSIDLKDKEWRRHAERARDLLEAGKYKEAYRAIQNKHRNYEGSTKADALWLSGWINLRFLNKPAQAIEDFKLLHKSVGYPISLSRAQYWIGRSYEQMGKSSEARFWYKEASRFYNTFYGQLGALKIDRNYHIELPEYPSPDFMDAKEFIKDERVKAARLLDEIGEGQYARLFLIKYLGESERSVQDYSLAALLGQQTVNYEWAVLAGKKADQAHVMIPKANYPVLMFTPPAPEKALVMAIIRQESQLNRYAESSAGARGMMQLMPATAKSVAKEMGMVYSPAKLFDKDYNMALGSFYLNKRINNVEGSYIMAIAAYNAGIGNVYKWRDRFGDPRTLRDPEQIIDWLESIPFSETRNYVQRVLENTQIYRARLNNGKHRLMLIEDLTR
ncbi:MAG: hypothetical protein COV36_07260 [Alphaproteobacteria bacterium CG11_big_fil_rev_8_21_14_0_20_44_7]|nr:MAG: hypothetical protein COV36_07260 [Alphaproteobacteria bacterium CG11_big_fil_rev_8_21_14_0_20_44_7]